MALKYLYVPSGYKAGTAYGVLPNVANADLALVRGSAGTRTNSDGLIESMATNVPRLDYADGSCPTLLTEPESTNLCLNSAEGTYGNFPASTAQTVAPDGTNTATIPTVNSVSNRYEYVIPAGTYATDTKITYSWYRKRISTPLDSTYIGDLRLTGFVNCSQVGSTTQIGSDIGGYDRFSTTFNITDGALQSKLRLYFGYVIGVGNSSIAYFGHQVEVGEYATSYIPTNGATVTRSADTEVVSGDLSSYLNSSEGVLEIKAKALFNNLINREITLGDDTNNKSLTFRYSSVSNKIQGVFVKDSETVSVEYVVSDITEFNTIKIMWNATSIKLKVNGVERDSDTITGFSENTLTKLKLQRSGSGRAFEGNVQYIKVYDSITDF